MEYRRNIMMIIEICEQRVVSARMGADIECRSNFLWDVRDTRLLGFAKSAHMKSTLHVI